MKGLVMTSGCGRGLRPLTHAVPRPLLPIANQPSLFYDLRNLRACGIREVALIGDDQCQIARAVGGGGRFGLDVTYLRQERPSGLGHAITIARDFLGDDDFVTLVAGNVVLGGFRDLVRTYRQARPEAVVLAGKVADPRRFSVVDAAPDGAVSAVEDQPRQPRGELALVGTYLFSPAIHQAIAGSRPNWHGDWSVADALRWLLQRDLRVHAQVLPAPWPDSGEPDGLLECNRAILDRLRARVDGEIDQSSTIEGPVVVEEGAVVRGSRLVGPLVIGRDCLVVDSTVGRYASIGADCVLRDAHVENSIILSGARLTARQPIRGSLIGRDARVGNAPPTGRDGTRLVLADHSDIQLAP